MGPASSLRLVVALLLVGSAALAQQGLIVQPWPKSETAASVPVVAPRVMPGSGLPAGAAPAASSPAAPSIERSPQPGEAAPRGKWSPPVLTLLVDPWKGAATAAPPPRSHWTPERPEIIDPWARSEADPPPRVASRPAPSAPRSTIF